MTRLPAAYAWLNAEPGPKMLVEALKLYGTLEGPGVADNPAIEAWADEVQAAVPTPYNRWAASFYDNDAIAWCGLFMALVAVRANTDRRPERWPPDKYLSALSWTAFGQPVAKALPMLGDVVVFSRDGGGHVGLHVGEDHEAIHVLGGNTGDQVKVARIAKLRLVAVRRPPYQVSPANVRRVLLAPAGDLSRNEA